MRTPRVTTTKRQPLSISLSRFGTATAVFAALCAAGASAHGQSTWDGATLPTPGDGLLWTDALNWSGDVLPGGGDVIFANPAASVGTIYLNGDQTSNTLTFTVNDTIGAYGTSNLLTNSTGLVTVNLGVFATMNASYAGTNGVSLSGGGSLFMNHPLPTFGGNISVDGAGSSLVYKSDLVYPQYSGIAATQNFGRGDWFELGFTTATRTINLTNGGEFKLLGAGNNAEANHKNILIGAGGGTVRLAAGLTHLNLDDVGQIANSFGNTFTLAGNGRLTIAGAMADANPLAGDVVVAGGILELNRLQGASTTANTRFSGFTGTTSTSIGTNSLTVNNGGVLMLNNGTIGNLDVASLILNNGSVLSIQSNNQEIGVRTQGGATNASTMQVNGTVSMMHRDLLGAQTQRNFFINSDLTGAGTLSILPSTGAGSAGRIVIQRAVGSTFSGTFKLNENANLELNPRANVVVDTGKLLADGDIDFAGWGSTLDVRDSDSSAANIKDYTNNEITVSSTQAGSVNVISLTRATTATGAGQPV